MKKVLVMLAAVGLIAGAIGVCQGEEKDVYGLKGKTHSAVTPTARKNDEQWMKRHQNILKQVASQPVDLVFFGDSITHFWEANPYWKADGQKVWNQYYAKRNAVNMSHGGDRTQQVLWRLENGEVSGISPKLAILMIGTNNSPDNTAEEVADGIKAICASIQKKMPKTKILILAIFPWGDPPSPEMKADAAASEMASKIADGKTIFYLNINDKFLKADGTIRKDLLPDSLHPNEKGYRVWAEAMEPTVKKLMGEKE